MTHILFTYVTWLILTMFSKTLDCSKKAERGAKQEDIPLLRRLCLPHLLKERHKAVESKPVPFFQAVGLANFPTAKFLIQLHCLQCLSNPHPLQTGLNHIDLNLP